MIPPFDLFRTEADGTVKWQGVCADLDAAKSRVLELSAALPAKYFISSLTTGNSLFIKPDGQSSDRPRGREERFFLPKRILIVEDEASVRKAIRTFIESHSQFDICEAADGEEAIKKAHTLKPDLVVLDLNLPIANGIEVAARLNVSMPKTPVVIFTMFEHLLGKPLAKILGIAAVVPKSDGVGKLLGRIEALLDAQDALARQGY